MPFRQELKLREGICEVRIGQGNVALGLKIFVDADYPVVHVLGESGTPFAVKVFVESWRTEPQLVPGDSAQTLSGAPFRLVQAADFFPKVGNDAVSWYHRNESSLAFEETVKLQSLQPIRSIMKDSLIHRTFGGWVTGRNFTATDERTLVSRAPEKSFHLRIASPSEQTDTADVWLTLARNFAKKTENNATSLKRTAAWWGEFWNRSWVDCATPTLDGDLGQDKPSANAASMSVGKAHTLQRYMQACAGHSSFPIKFNGSIFTVEPTALGRKDNPDFRRWGDCYWWQNIRIPYHAMQATGDFDLMIPLFDFFERIRPFSEARTKLYYNAEGVYFPEVVNAWGAYSNRHYGWDRKGKQPGDVASMYWRHTWNQGLELVSLMLDYYDYTGDDKFFKVRLLPMASSVLKYFDTRFRKDASGRMIIEPTQVAETYWHDVINDTPNLAGLKDVTDRLCAVSPQLLTEDQHRFFAQIKSSLPPIPFGDAKKDGQTVRLIAVAEKYNPKCSNIENPELYPIWPFRIFGLQKPMLEEARNTVSVVPGAS